MTHSEQTQAAQQTPDDLPPLSIPVLAALVAAKIALHIPGLFRYGYFRDELYFLDCARHLDWGYVDHAPLVAVYAKIALLLGGSLPALRVLPILAGAGMVALTVLIARQLGGDTFAQALAGIAILFAPVYLMIDSILSMNAFEPLFWMGCVWVLIRIVRTGDSRLWLLFGVLAGLGLENKHSTLFFGAAVAVAILATPLRRELLRPWIWLGAAVALAIFLPNLIWQWQHGFPTLEDLENVRTIGKNVELAPGAFMVQQILMLNPATLPVWLAGLWFLLAGGGRRFRVLGWTYVSLLAALMALHAKDYYLAPIYPMLFAAGGAAFAGWTSARARISHQVSAAAGVASHPAVLSRLGVLDVRSSTPPRPSGRKPHWARRLAALATNPGEICGLASDRMRIPVRALLALSLAVPGAVFAPLALPILEPASFIAYQQGLGFAPEKTEVAHEGPMPQLWGDQFGWPELVSDVADIYNSLPAEERSRTGIFASNYGEAGAINLFGPEHGLPPAICAHQTHSMWGPGDFRGENLIWLQWEPEWLEGRCDSVEIVGEHHNPWGMEEENRPILLCRGLTVPLPEQWPDLRHWN